MKLKIVKGKNYDALREEEKCISCNGSGFYDDWNVKAGKPYECAACNGTGVK